MRVVAYVRVSTDSKDQENSFINQKEYFEELANSTPDYELVDMYADKGITGTSLYKRPEFNRMLLDAGLSVTPQEDGGNYIGFTDNEPKFDMILVKNTSRLARNSDIFSAVRMLRHKGVYIKFLDMNKTTADETNDLMLKIMFGIDEEDSKDKARKVRFGHQQGMKKGVIPNACFGYDKIDKYTLSINEKEAEIVRFIFENYVNGMGIRPIANACNDKGYKSKRGGKFHKSSVNLILKQPMYKGTLVRNQHNYSTLTQRKIDLKEFKPEDDWVVIEEHEGIPPIIDKEVWETAHEILNSRSDKMGTRGIRKSKSEFIGMLKCAKCGQSYRVNSDGQYRFYNCGTKREQGSKVCNAYNITEKKVKDQINEYAESQYHVYMTANIQDNIFKLEKIKIDIMNKMTAEQDMSEINMLNQKIIEAQERKGKLLDLYLDGALDKALLDSRMGKVEIELNELTEKFQNATKSTEQYRSEILAIDDTIKRMESMEIKESYSYDEIINEIDTMTVVSSTKEEWKLAFGEDRPYEKAYVIPWFKADKLIQELVEKYDKNS